MTHKASLPLLCGRAVGTRTLKLKVFLWESSYQLTPKTFSSKHVAGKHANHLLNIP